MTSGEPLKKTQDAESDPTDPILVTPLQDGPDRDRHAMLSETTDLLSQTMEEETALLDAEVSTLMSAIAEEESEHDEAWVEASRQDAEAGADNDDFERSGSMEHPDDGTIEPVDGDTGESHDPPSTDQVAPEALATSADAFRDHENVPPMDAASAEPPRDELGLRAIDALNEKFEAAESRNGEALGRIGHALGMIATRIDGLESRATDRTIADLAFVAAPPEDDEDDASVAPYIARAEKELKAKKESGSMDIFDRIARAAETKFDDETESGETRVIANTSDGRRVGTKRWQPSRAVKKRMELLEKTRAEKQPAARPPASRKLRVETEDGTASTIRAERVREHEDAPLDTAAESAFDAHDELFEEDDAGLSVVPGARGRRRNRARKSALDSDFENVFSEEGGKPSIQSLRRKMRERPVEDPELAEKAKGGMLDSILGRKPAKKGDPALDGDRGDDEDLMAAFDAPDAAPAEDPSEKPARSAKAKAKAKAKKVKPVAIDEDDDFDEDEDWDEDDLEAPDSRRKLMVYAMIAFASVAGYMVWKMFLA